MPVQIPEDAKSWTVVQDSGANAAQTVSQPAGAAGTKHYVTGFEVVITGAASGAVVTVDVQENPATNRWRSAIPSGAAIGTTLARDFAYPIEIAAATAAELEVSAGGVACVTRASFKGYTLSAA